jgi:hypothetical protein
MRKKYFKIFFIFFINRHKVGLFFLFLMYRHKGGVSHHNAPTKYWQGEVPLYKLIKTIIMELIKCIEISPVKTNKVTGKSFQTVKFEREAQNVVTTLPDGKVVRTIKKGVSACTNIGAKSPHYNAYSVGEYAPGIIENISVEMYELVDDEGVVSEHTNRNIIIFGDTEDKAFANSRQNAYEYNGAITGIVSKAETL